MSFYVFPTIINKNATKLVVNRKLIFIVICAHYLCVLFFEKYRFSHAWPFGLAQLGFQLFMT